MLANSYRANSYQHAVLEFVRGGSGHAVVEATAGSGKTTTLVMVARSLVDEVLEEGQLAAFLAFNRSTAAELRARLPPQVEAVTLHSLGRRVLAASRPTGLELEPGKYSRLARDLIESSSSGGHGTRRGAVAIGREHGHDHDVAAAPTTAALADHVNYLADLFGFARLELADFADPGAAQRLRDRYGIRPPLPAAELAVLDALLPQLALAGERAPSIDYTDMIYLPLRLELVVPRFAFICVDEAQDLSRLALAFVQRLIAEGARALFVGDPHQAIYAFAGADAGSLGRVQQLTAANRLPLSVSFRCPSRHVVLARRFSPEMLPAPGRTAGSVSVTSLEQLPRLAQPGDLLLARTNAPLPELALRLVSSGKAVRILGHDLVSDAKALARELFGEMFGESGRGSNGGSIGGSNGGSNGGSKRGSNGRSFDGRSISSLQAEVRASAEAERVRLEFELLTSDELPAALDRSRHAHEALLLALNWLTRTPTNLDSEARAGALEGTLANTLENTNTNTLENTLENRLDVELDEHFSGTGRHLLLSTIHKAKGREADRVFLLQPERLGFGGTLPADLAEANVLFVALTRAKRELVLVEEEPGAIELRLARSGPLDPADLTSRWQDVLRLASVMSGRAPEHGLSSAHGKARRVQDRWWQAGGSRRRPRWRQDRQRGGHR